tara:strand:+ start:22595 stop:23299 length:705 start_codon:yes stop_codon:yes gene_type:complete
LADIPQNAVLLASQKQGGLTMSKDMLGVAVRKLVTLPDSTLGTVCDHLEKMADPEWVEATKKFLRKEEAWPKTVPCDWGVWKTVNLGTGLRTADDFRSAFKEGGFKASDWANDILGKPKFKASESKEKVNLAQVSVAELGFSEGGTTEQIFRRAKELGLELCPSEVGPQLRLQYKDQPEGEWIRIAMNPITDSDGDPSVFNVGCVRVELWLNAFYASPGFVWLPGSVLVFCLSK